MLQQHRWSSLSDDIIAKIISHLNFPQYSTVKISATYFDANLFESVKDNLPEIWNILDNLFTIFTTPSINTISIHLHHTLYEEPGVRSILDSWVGRLCGGNTRHIKIRSACFCRFADRVCPPSLFQIHSLESLDISLFHDECYRFVSHPIILPNLKRLTLLSVNYGFFRWLLSSCPSLEDLTFSLIVKPMGRNGSVSILSKNLKRLRITLDMSWVRGDIDVIIDVPILEHLHFSADSPLVSMRMFNSISNLKSLELSGAPTTNLDDSPADSIFPNMTHLRLSVSSSEVLQAMFKQQMLHCPSLLEVPQFYSF